jgi:hypothetical protein
MNRTLFCRLASLFSIFLLLSASVLPAVGARHPLSTLEHNRTTGVSDIDITISLDWDPDEVTNTAKVTRGMTKSEMETAVKEYAASLFAMTNGLHRLRNVYIFRDKKSWSSADITYTGTKAGRSAANVAGWNQPNTQIDMFTYDYNEKTKEYEWDKYPGPVMAHETGHYIYGLMDEYRESGGKTIKELKEARNLSTPSGEDDNTQPSIMNDHEVWQNWFSHAESYQGKPTGDAASKYDTAQYRAYEKSIWDTLTSDPTTDPEYARSFGRTQYEAFKDKQVKTAKDLKAPRSGKLAGYDSVLNIVWVDAPVLNLVLLDSNIPSAKWQEAQAGAGSIAQNAPADSYLQVMSGSGIGVQRTLLTDDNRSDLSSQAGAVEQDESVSLETALRAAIEEVKKYRATLTTPQVSSLYLLTSSNQLVSAALLKELRQNNVALKVFYSEARFGLKGTRAAVRPAPRLIKSSDTELADNEKIYLSQISRATGGSFSTVRSAAQLESETAKAAGGSDGDGFATLAGSFASSLPAGGKHELSFRIGRHDLLPIIVLAAEDSDFANLTPSLTSPAGEKIQADNLPKGIELETDQENSSWYFVIDPESYSGAEGAWVATLTAKAPVSNDLGIMAASPSLLQMQIDVTQRPLTGNLLEVSLSLDRPVLQAAVRADVYDESGNRVRSGLRLADDGKNGDLRPDDGIYTVALNDLPPGEYSFLVSADDNNGAAVASDRGTFFNVRAGKVADEPTGAFQRTDEETFVVAEQQASSGGGGGCAIGGNGNTDLLLLLTFTFPLLYLVSLVRRGRRHRP